MTKELMERERDTGKEWADSEGFQQQALREWDVGWRWEGHLSDHNQRASCSTSSPSSKLQQITE